jgi:TonB-dependent starch-binding outer membrane protein SusC
MRKITIMLVFLFAACISQVYAQTNTITGRVTSADDGTGLPGVTVFVKGTTTGTVTDMDGNYTLFVPQTARTLVFSFIGLRTIEVEIQGRTSINATMETDAYALDEIVVVGYGVQQRRDVSGSISTVKGEDIRNAPIQTFDQALQGKAAGVNLTIPNAVLGNPPVIRVRGFNSISGSSNPLIIVDGVPVFTGDVSRTQATLNTLGDINPNDIESVEILKDASATAIYGSRAANGVILITTRKGQLGKTQVNYDYNIGWSSASRIYDVMNAEQFVEHKNRAWVNAGQNPDALPYKLANDANGNLIDTDWNDVIYQTGMQQSHALSFSGGNLATSYFVSLGYATNEGIIRTNTYDRTSARLNIDHKLTDYLTLGANVAIASTFSSGPNSGSIAGSNFSTAGVGRIAFLYAPNVPLYVDTPTNPNQHPKKGDPTRYYNIGSNNLLGLLENTQGVGFFHPEFLFDHNYHNAQSDRILSTVYGNLRIIPGLFFRSALGLDNSAVESKTFWDRRHGDGQTRGGDAYNYFDRRNRWNWTNTLNYMFSLSEVTNFNVLIGSEEQYSEFNGWSGGRTGLADPFFTSYQGTFTTNAIPPTLVQTENYFTSFFGRVNFNYDQKYYVEFSARRDGFSGLAAGKKYGNFSGASVMWNLSRESFIRNSSISNFLSDLRLKGSFGQVGNISGISDFGSLFLYSAGLYNANPTLFFSQAGNPDLEWETSNKFDLGLAFGLLSDRIQVEAGYYKNDIDGLILNVPQAPSKGIPNNQIPANVGAMFNTGIEVTITSYNYQTSNFRWTTNLNFATLKNEVTELAPGIDELIGITQLETTNRTVVGYPIGQIWGVETAGVDPATGRRIFIKRTVNAETGEVTTSNVYYGHGTNWPDGQAGWRNEDGTVSRAINITDDGVVLGSPLPTFYGGMDNNFSYKNFDASIGLTFATGFHIYNGSKAGLRDQRTWNNTVEVYNDAWRQPGDVTDIPRPIFGDNISNGSTMVQSQNVEKGDFLKLRNLSIGYTVKSDWLRRNGITNLRVYTQMFNILSFTGYTGADPEISSTGDANLTPGVDRNSVPQARTYSFGVNLAF